MTEQKSRLRLIDTLRGMAVVSMVLFHFAWDLKYILRLKIDLYSDMGIIWQQSICWTFILISGFCFHFSKNSLKNGLITFLCGGIVSAVTIFFMPDSAIYFGILTFLGSAMLILSPLKPILSKIPSSVGTIISFFCFLVCFNINRGHLFFGEIFLPKSLYSNMFTAFLGFPNSRFSSSDYFPLLPWIFLFLTGFFLSGFLKNKSIPKLLNFGIPPFEWIGKKALIIYMLHQPVLYLLTLLLGVLINGN